MLSLNEMSITDGISNEILYAPKENDSDDLMLNSINTLIREHRNTFLPSKNNFTIDNAKRYNDTSRFEVSMIQSNHKKILACKFCGSTEQGERLSSCKKMNKIKR